MSSDKSITHGGKWRVSRGTRSPIEEVVDGCNFVYLHRSPRMYLRELRDRLRDSRVSFDPAPGGQKPRKKHFLRDGVEVRVIKVAEHAKHSGSQVDSIGEKFPLAQSTRGEGCFDTKSRHGTGCPRSGNLSKIYIHLVFFPDEASPQRNYYTCTLSTDHGYVKCDT